MGKSSSQVIGYRYFAKFAMFIGNRIEKLIAVNFDNRGWHVRRPGEPEPNLAVSAPNLYGENEGGVVGVIDVFIGHPDQQPSEAYQQYLPLVSGYPYQSYLVFRSGANNGGFYLGNSGYMKEMLLWVKRTRVRNDGRVQWYMFNSYMDMVCEIGTSAENPAMPEFDPNKQLTFTSTSRGEDNYNDTTYTVDRIKEVIKFNSYQNAVYENFLGGSQRSFNEKNPPVRVSCAARLYTPAVFNGVARKNIRINTHGDYNIRVLTSGRIFKYLVETEKDEDYTNTHDISIDLEYESNFECTVIIETKGFSTILNTETSGVYANNHYIGVSAREDFYVGPGFPDQIFSENPDINPIHKIREILTDDTAMGKPESDINDLNFMKAADHIWNEGLGISWAIDEKSCIEAIEELCYHIEAGIRVNRQTGLYEMVLFRDDWFDENEIHDITENKIKDLTLEVMNSGDIVNQLNVTYYDRQRIKNSTFSVYENGSILTMGHANAESVEFPYFMNMRNAEIVANWKLKQFSTPAWSGSFSTGWREARKWNRYDLIRLPWSSKWNGTILVRIMKINLGNGTDNTVTIDFEEVVPYSGEMNTSIVVDESMNAGVQPPQPSINAVFEAPYYLTVLRAGQTNTDLELSNNPDIGYVAAIAAKPQSNSLNALLYTDGGVGELEQVSRLDYCDILQLDQPITETTSSFVVTGSLTQTVNSNNLILLNSELMGFVSFDDVTRVLTVKRGALDTVPKKYSSGSLFVFDLPDVAFDSTQYAQSEVVEAQVLTTTPSGIQDLLETGQSIEIKSRAIRPYPPANVKINGEYWPETHIITNDIVLTWVDRNRLQQTGGGFLGFFDTGVTVESGVTYSYELICENVVLDSASGLSANTASILASALVPNKPHTLKLWSVREGFESYQTFEHSFFAESASLILTASANKNSVTGNTVPAANILVNVDSSLSANMQFDGSSIKGKAPAGSVITIEVEE